MQTIVNVLNTDPRKSISLTRQYFKLNYVIQQPYVLEKKLFTIEVWSAGENK